MGNSEAEARQPHGEGERTPDEMAMDPEPGKHDPESDKNGPDAPAKPGTGDVPPATKFQP